MENINRRTFLSASVAGSLALAAKPAKRPNIVFIMADDLGYADVGCYGQQKIRTPNIDQLSREGMRFTDAYSGCTVCAPSRSVLMTGLHMGHTSVRSNPGGVPLLADDITVAQVLKKAGYATGGFGKWGLGDIGTSGVPSKHGFDEFFGYLNQVHAHFYYPEFLIDNEKRYPLRGNGNGKRTTYSHDVIAERALAFIRKHKDQPFFCYVPVTLPHLELLVPEDSMAEYKGKFPEPKPFESTHYARQESPRTAYAGMVTRMDRTVGSIMALLRELRLEENTVLFFTSDNGAATPLWKDDFFNSTGPLRGHKQNFYEGGIRVPSIVRWPGRIGAGTVNNHPWAFYDFMPTAAELAGADPVKGSDGISIVPALIGANAAGREQKKHDFMYWELPRYIGKTGEFRKELPPAAVRMANWKAVRPAPDAALELYNLQSDIGETRNVAAEHSDIMAKIERYLKTARTEPRPQLDPTPGWKQFISGS
ncbi:MAG: arylsulfatase [Acidobacteria bacterium]|nr:arylsulfatase [Acidobacteriota bacterium]